MTTQNVKKAYVELARILNENADRKVKSILPELMEIMTSKGSGGSDIGKTFLKDEDGNVFAVYCYYHKKWELTSECEYGSKKGTATGLNTMCKEGVSNWTKQQRIAKKAKEQLLSQIADGELSVEELPQAQADIEAERDIIVAREDGQGYDSADEVSEVFANNVNEELG